MKGALLILTLAAGFASAASAGASIRPDFVGYAPATRATGHPVLCATSERDWKALAARWNEQGSIGFWHPPFILVDRTDCDYLRHWRTADAFDVGYAVFVLAHESGHADQLAEGAPYDEHDADCRGVSKWRSVKRALGIRRPLPPPETYPLRRCV
jgi:hypothetical protein